MTNLNRTQREKLIEVLCSQALADHLGDVRDAEVGLWELLGISEVCRDYDSAWQNTRATLERNAYMLPEYLRE